MKKKEDLKQFSSAKKHLILLPTILFLNQTTREIDFQMMPHDIKKTMTKVTLILEIYNLTKTVLFLYRISGQ